VPISAARILEAARVLPGTHINLSDAGGALTFGAGEISVDVEFIDGDWCVLRCSEDALRLLARVANLADCDVKGGEGEVYRWAGDEVVLVRSAEVSPRRALLVRYPWLPVATILSLLALVYATRVIMGI
jgi:hypothetical protein